MRALSGLLALAALVAGCRSPFGAGVETGPPDDPARVGSGVHAWPLYESVFEGSEHRDDVLWPAWSRRVDATSGDLRRLDLLYPVFLREVYADGSRIGIRPLFDVESRERTDGSVSDVDLLFPLVKWRNSPERTLLRIAPLYERTKTATMEDTVLFPFYWRLDSEPRSHLHWFPFWGREREGTWERRWYGTPLFARGADPETGRTDWDVLWPLFHGMTRGGDWRFRALPVYSGAREGDRRHTVIVPFWWEFEDADSSFRMLLPIYGRQRGKDLERTIYGGPLWISTRDGDSRSTDALFPVFHHETDPEGWGFRAFPVLWLERRANRELTAVWPLYGEDRTVDRTKHSVAWPFFVHTRRADSWSLDAPFPFVHFRRGGSVSESRVSPLFRHETTARGSSGDILLQVARWRSDADSGSLRVLWRLVDSGHTPERSHFALNPLFRWETNARGDRHWSVLLGLVARTTDADGARWRLLWFL